MKPMKDVWPLNTTDSLVLLLIIMAYLMFYIGWWAGSHQ